MALTTTTTRPHDTVRVATDRERFRNGFGPTGEAVCDCCGTEAAEQYVYGTMTPNGMAWSPAYCGRDCHEAMMEEWT